ncbi:MAG: hypothetical protein GXO89_14485 [Chlorobi bacterium]|nr:hypothetical protein [Chlorobiota bacterium]
MKIHLRIHYGIYLFGGSMLFLLSFVPAKYSAGFKKGKKGIETLTIYSPVVHIVANDKRTEYLDSVLTKKNQIFLDSLTHDLLFKKYTLESTSLPMFDMNVFTGLFEQLEDSPKLLDNISAKQLLGELNLEHKSKFALMLVYSGTVNPDFPPHFNVLYGLASNTLIIDPSTKPYSEMRLMIIDTESEDVVFYDMVKTSNFDPRISGEVEQLAKKILRKIYYK